MDTYIKTYEREEHDSPNRIRRTLEDNEMQRSEKTKLVRHSYDSSLSLKSVDMENEMAGGRASNRLDL